MTTEHAIPDSARSAAGELGFELDEPTWQQLARFLALLLERNQTTNLTAVRDPEQAWPRLILDSLTVLPAFEDLPEQARVIDVGTGGGLPGVPLAIARPDLRFTLLDSTGKKVAFIRETAETLGLDNITAIQDRAETLAHNATHRQQYDLAVSRAVGPLPTLLELTLPFVRQEGWCLAMKGPRVEQELADSGDALYKLGAGDLRVIDAYPECFENDLVLVLIHKERNTPKTYPRESGLPKRSPL
ncbi:16S rRNA (guanine(527)-N(7))-methyltransferase RsmG [Mucisphaera calidilacus]|uniref:Ribosomal RNA small subunit methyltransferase G n=1 Tax=Mucisphaera calidilacus TaxID=2527982 RepID=A0A518BXG2_9BACT|nr:16S rRNA (guanine(527)-N(7))-methyltransferase RsmG [Mucisphaera calidilacus]QDU71667.1 Ribosomal RNA small subunit methyltransferase G [Mucisphaera calidilacus]